MKRKLTATNLIGPGVAPVDRAYVEIAPAYPFDDGSATNWDIPVRINLVDGAIPAGDEPLLEDTYLGVPMTWNIRVVFEDARAKFIGGSRQVAFQLPEGTGDVDYTDLLAVDVITIPELGPTWAAQAEVAATGAATSATAAAAEAAAAETARAAAVAAQTAAAATAAAIPTTNDPIVKGLLDNPASQTSIKLAGTFVTKHVHVFACDGQSNMSGRGIPYSTFTDPVHPRIKQFPGRGSSVGTIIAASEPLIMHDTASGIGPALQFARNLLDVLPPDDIILLVPNAHGGTMLPTDTTPLGWRWGISGNLAEQAVTNTNAALAAARAAYPTATVTLDAVLWLEGETAGTNSIAGTVYQADLDAYIAGVRTAYSNSALPFIMGGMVPEGLSVGTRTAINTVHSDTPYRVARTGWSPGVAGKQNGDNLHYNSAGQVDIGRLMFNEYQRVTSGRRPVNADLVVPPVTIPTPGATAWEDSFNRSDTGEVVATDTSGKSWGRDLLTSSTARFGIVSNAGAPIYTSTGGSAFYTVDAAISAIQLHAENTVINASFRIVFWYIDTSNYVALVPASATSLELRKVVAGTSTTVATFTVASSTSKTFDVVATSPTDVSVWSDGVSLLSHGSQLTGVTTSTKAGVQVTSTSTVGAARLDLIRVSAIA